MAVSFPQETTAALSPLCQKACCAAFADSAADAVGRVSILRASSSPLAFITPRMRFSHAARSLQTSLMTVSDGVMVRGKKRCG